MGIDQHSTLLETIHAQMTAEFEYLEIREAEMRALASQRFRLLCTLVLVQIGALIVAIAFMHK